LASERTHEIREVNCLGCDTINQVKIGIYASGIKTIFCKKCGEEIQLTYDRTPVGLELKRGDKGPN